MSVLVPDILSQASASKKRMSPVDVVMGDHWAEIKLGNSMRLSLLGLMLKKQKQFGGQSGRGGSPALRNLSFQVVRRGPQAMVKVIRIWTSTGFKCHQVLCRNMKSPGGSSETEIYTNPPTNHSVSPCAD